VAEVAEAVAGRAEAVAGRAEAGAGRAEAVAFDRAALAASIGARVAAAVGLAPRRVVLVAAGALPRTGSGKVQPEELRRRLVGGEMAGAILHGWP